MTTTENSLSETVAAIDLGSNSFHMIVARLGKSGTLSVIDRLRENVRLGGGLDAHGSINEDAKNRAFESLESFAQRIRNLPHSCVRIAGTIKAITGIVREQSWCLNGISYKSLLLLREAAINSGHIDNLKLSELSPSRKPVIAGDLSVLLEVFKTLEIEHMEVSNQGMRESLLYDLVGRITYHDVRDATIESMMSRWGIDIEQAKRVANTVERLFDQTYKQDSVDAPQLKPLLKWAALLRIAVLLHRGRTNLSIPDINITVYNKAINLKFPDDWLDNHNMTLADFIKEVDYLDTTGYQLSFE